MEIKLSERDVLNSVIQHLEIRKILYIRNNTGAASYTDKEEHHRFVRFGSKGSPDILFFRNNKSYAVECKSSTGRQSLYQLSWQREFEKAGGIYLLVRKPEDVLNFIN